MTNQDGYKRKRLVLRFFIILGLFFLALPVPIWAKNYTQSFENGMIDWSNGFIDAVGIGAPPAKPINSAQARALAERTALTTARRNLGEIVYSIKVDSRTLIKDFVLPNPVLRAELDNLLRNARVVETSYLSNGSVKTSVEIKLTGAIADLVLPKTICNIKPVQQPQASNQGGKGIFTGLVVDCRGFLVKPAMAPRILDEEGKEVYGSAFVSRDYAVKQGMAGYAKGLKAASNPRVADRALSVKGIRTAKTGLCDIVVSNADAAKIRGTASNMSFLQRCRVMIVLD